VGELERQTYKVPALRGGASKVIEEEYSEPPRGALRQPDGAYTAVMADGSTYRWSQRPDGSWRKPERVGAGRATALEQVRAAVPLGRSIPGADDSMLEGADQKTKNARKNERKKELRREKAEAKEADRVANAPTLSEVLAAAQPRISPPEPEVSSPEKNGTAAESPPSEGRLSRGGDSNKSVPLELTREPPSNAELLGDGTYSLTLEDGSTVRWTKRPDGTWRKPERTRAGFVGELEQKKYKCPGLHQEERLKAVLDDEEELEAALTKLRIGDEEKQVTAGGEVQSEANHKKKLEKKLRQIAELEEKRAQGQELLPEQLAKLAAKAEVEAELAAFSFQ